MVRPEHMYQNTNQTKPRQVYTLKEDWQVLHTEPVSVQKVVLCLRGQGESWGGTEESNLSF